MSNNNKIDAIDVLLGLGGIALVASAPTLLVALPVVAVGLGIRALKNSERAYHWATTKDDSRVGYLRDAAKMMLPRPEGEQITAIEKKQKPLDVDIKMRNGDPNQRSWADRITKPMEYPAELITTNQLALPEKQSTAINMAKALQNMPKRINYDHPQVPEAPTPMSVLIGYDAIARKWVWADFGINGDTIHAFIAGQTRAGKDSEMRLWFTQLTSNNKPDDLQFIIIDGKGEWITPALKKAKHMLVAPNGGFDPYLDEKGRLKDRANEALEQSIIDAFQILKQRNEMFQKAGATNYQSYIRKTGHKIPMIFVIATDVGTNLEGNLEVLIKMLLLKGGSLGVRAIISMQTASGEDTSWRGQFGLTMSGYQGQSSADKPNMGIPVSAMRYRPSELPSVDIPDNRGLFVVRKGNDQYVVRGVYLPDHVFEEYCENILPRQIKIYDAVDNNDFLSDMLAIQQPKKQVKTPLVLTKQQAILTAQLAAKGVSASKILTDYLKFTSGERYAQALPHVEAIVTAIKAKQRKS